MIKLTESEANIFVTLALFLTLYVVNVDLYLLIIFAITVHEITLFFTEYAESQVQFYLAYLKYLKEHSNDDEGVR